MNHPIISPAQLYEKLLKWFTPYHTVLVAFSAGVDSTLVLHAAVESLGLKRVIAVTADSPSLARRELEEAKALTAKLGVRHVIILSQELENPNYSQNDSDRCYYCKKSFYCELLTQAPVIVSTVHGEQSSGSATDSWLIVDGANADDLRDIRPGLRAAAEAGVAHPFVECGFGKDEVRKLSLHCGLPTWDKPEMACLASRIQNSTQVSANKLAMVEQAEESLRSLGFSNLRVRYHELSSPSPDNPNQTIPTLARIELSTESIEQAAAPRIRENIIRGVKNAGFSFVVLDLEGYKKGGRAKVS